MNASDTNTLLKLVNISKQYPGVQALDKVSLDVRKGEIHALVGENGAGKSTLVNIIGGNVKADSGSITFNGRIVDINNPKQAAEIGIALVHQELSLFPNLTIANNLYLSILDNQGAFFVPDKLLESQARQVLCRMGLEHLTPTKKIAHLQPGEKQLVEIAASIVKDAKLIVLDEPTSSLTGREIETLFRIIRELKGQGISIIYVSHRLDEIFELCDRVTVLRDGKHIITTPTKSLNTGKLVELILGRKLGEMYTTREVKPKKEVILQVKNLWKEPKLRGIHFHLHKGEILGIAGLLGSGRSELVRAIFGLEKIDQGEIYLNGQSVKIKNPAQAIRLGIGYITEDRHKEGLVIEKSVKDNITLANLKKFATSFGWMMATKEYQAAMRQKEKLNIVTPSILKKVKYLSGGNQQKVVLGKWLETSPKVFFLDEPTRGIDVGAKAEFFKIIQDLARDGAGIVFISSELQEIVSVCHRVLVLRDGRFIEEFTNDNLDAAKILVKMTGEYNDGKQQSPTLERKGNRKTN